MPSPEKVKPFPHFMKFLEREQEAVARLAESQPIKKRFPRQQYHTSANGRMTKFYKCAYPAHRKDNINHTTNECKEFQKLPLSGKQGRYEVLKQVNACKTVARKTPARPVEVSCIMFCCVREKILKSGLETEQPKAHDDSREETHSHMVQSDAIALYPVSQAIVVESGRTVSVFCDRESNSSYITHRAAYRIKAKTIRKLTLHATTMGNIEVLQHMRIPNYDSNKNWQESHCQRIRYGKNNWPC